MEKVTFAFIALCLLLLLAQFFFQESFTGTVGFRPVGCPDASGNKSIANCVFSVRQQCTDPINPLKRVPCIGEPGDTDYSDASGNRVLCYNADMKPTGLCPDTAYNLDGDVGAGGWDGWTHWGGWGGRGQGRLSRDEDEEEDVSELGGRGRRAWGAPTRATSGMGTATDTGAGNYNAQFASLRDDIRKDIRRTIKKEVAKSCSSGEDADDCSADTSPAESQGAEFLKEVYGKDPNAYIKKDSIPCYGCSLP